MGAADQRLRRLAEKRLESSETMVATSRVWYSRPLRIAILSARYRDFIVLTDRRLMMYSAGWLTRMLRRRVLADRLTDLTVTAPRHERTLEVAHPNRPPMRLEFGSSLESDTIVAALRVPAAPQAHQTASLPIGDTSWLS